MEHHVHEMVPKSPPRAPGTTPDLIFLSISDASWIYFLMDYDIAKSGKSTAKLLVFVLLCAALLGKLA